MDVCVWLTAVDTSAHAIVLEYWNSVATDVPRDKLSEDILFCRWHLIFDKKSLKLHLRFATKGFELEQTVLALRRSLAVTSRAS